jgi:hypothetical protein
MTKPDFTLKFIKTSEDLRLLSERLLTLSAFALDLETSEWWNRHRERIALVQFAYRADDKIRVVILDALAELDLEPLRLPLEDTGIIKIIHNASFDAVRLQTHYNFQTAPVFDTMSAARRNGERKYSLAAQAQVHLNLRLDKSMQNSDWSRRPLDVRQLHYAAHDPCAALLLYEHQVRRGLTGEYLLRLPAPSKQNLLPLDEMPLAAPPVAAKAATDAPPRKPPFIKTNLTEEMIAILGIIAELPTRYSPDGLAASVGTMRVGLAGWIIDERLGVNAEPDEETVKLAIAELCENKLIEITATRRLQATEDGAEVWRGLKG